MNELKKLEIDNLPPDILTGDYEFHAFVHEHSIRGVQEPLAVLKFAKQGYLFMYRRKEKPAPTHEEIMTKWWKNEDGEWCRVESYNSNDSCYKTDRYCWVKKEWFYVRESADIPPEE